MARRDEAIRTLQRRIDWLENRISKAEAKGDSDLTFDKREKSALQYAVRHLSKCPRP